MKNTSTTIASLSEIQAILRRTPKSPLLSSGKFFKTGKGDYAEHDQFLGIPVPFLRKIAKQNDSLSLQSIQKLLKSKINEERFLALIILVSRYKKENDEVKEIIYTFYIKHLKYVNNWNLVDASAHLIMGAHLLKREKSILFTLAESKVLWNRRIAIVSTWYFIRNNQFQYTIKLAKILLSDEQDLIQKSVGWMLREIGKRDKSILMNFLKKEGEKMPRTMWRYAIEKLSLEERYALVA